MRIALIVEWLDPWRGGAETSTGQFLRHLTALGVEVDVFTRSRAASAPGLTIHTVRPGSPSPLRNSMLFPARAAEAVRDSDCDLVHAIVPCPAADVFQPRGGTVAETIQRNIALRATRTRQRVKFWLNRLNRKQRSRLRLEKQLLNRSPRPTVVAISDYVRQQLIRHYDFPPSHIRKIYNGVEPDTTTAEQRQANRNDVRSLHRIGDADVLALLVAHNFKLKGVRRWIDALTRLPNPERSALRTVIVGKENPIRWQRLVTHLGLAERIVFAGPTRRIQAYYHAADFLVHPTYYDPCSRVVLESLASGLPCITTRFDGAAESIDNGETGFVLDSPDDTDALLDRTRKLLDTERRRQMAANAARLEDGILMQRHAQQMVALYKELLGKERNQ